ncbi:MAG: PKD domain-containing protein [Bacteroidetes bacterium]|nr:PKD domain-containing protein [Bacteroidota bacterium]
MKFINTLFLLMLSPVMVFCQQSSSSSLEFIENQGQWDAPFKYKASSPQGNIFLKSNGLRISLSDASNIAYLHGVHHGQPPTEKLFKYHAFDILFQDCNEQVSMSNQKPQKRYYNYYYGSNPAKWKSGIHPALAVDYHNLYNGIDAHLYSENGNPKYEFYVAPNASTDQIKLKYDGVDKLSISNDSLIIQTSLGLLKEPVPYCYQYIDDKKVEVKCKYALDGNMVSFKFPKGYNKNYQLIIDPVIVFCSFTGSTADNWGFTATNDTTGEFYAGGIVVNDQPGLSTVLTGSYPVTVGAIQINYGGGNNPGVGTGIVPTDVSVSKFDATGATLLYATYFGGTDNEQPHSMIVDHAGNLIIAGRTFSPSPAPPLASFPLTAGCYDNSYNGAGDIFVAKFNSTGTVLLGSTYVGGSGEDGVNTHLSELLIGGLKHNYADDARSEVIVDLNNNVYVTASTKSTNFPTTLNAIQPALGGLQDAVVFELNPNLTNLLWSTYLGGTANDAGYVLAINKFNQNELFVAGGTESTGFPSTAGTLHSTYQGGTADGFLLKFNTVSKALMAGTFIGTNQYDQVFGVQTDDSNHVFIVGQTMGAYPVTPGVFSVPNSSQFITKLDVNLTSILVSTVFGTGTLATTDIAINAFLVDKCQNIYVSGWGGPIIGGNPGSTIGLPLMNPLQATTDGSDYYFIVLSKNMLSQVYGSFFGQNGGGGEHVDGGTSRFDEDGVIYQAICSACGGGTQNFPVTPGAYSTTKATTTNCNFGALKIAFDFQNPDADAIASGNTTGCAPFTVQFLNNSTSAVNYVWNFGDGSPPTSTINPSHTFVNAGVYVVTLYASNPNGCTFSIDSTTLIITVKDDSINANFNFVKVDSCGPYTANFVNLSTNTGSGATTNYVWDFGDGSSVHNGPNPPMHNYPAAATYTITLTMTDTNACNSPSVITKVIDFNTSIVIAAFDMPDSVCMPAVVNFIDQSTNVTTYNWDFGDGSSSASSNPTHTFGSAGTYTVVLYTLNPSTCNKIDSVKQTIVIFPAPVADFNWAPNPPQPNVPNTFTNLSTGATSYLWNFGDGITSTNKDEIHIYQKDGFYDVCLTAMNEYGCIDTTCKRVRGMVVPLVDVPSGFSPNGDGNNDFVYVKGYGIETMTFRIFNRWGEKVFESTQQSVGWDGRYKGEMQEMEVYGYTLSVAFFDGTTDFKSGNITLLK